MQKLNSLIGSVSIPEINETIKYSATEGMEQLLEILVIPLDTPAMSILDRFCIQYQDREGTWCRIYNEQMYKLALLEA